MSAEVEVRRELDAARRRVRDLEQALALITGGQHAQTTPTRDRKHRTVLAPAERERRIVAVLDSVKPLTTNEVVERANAGTGNPVSQALHKLEAKGTVQEVSGNKRNNLLWRLASSTAEEAKPKSKAKRRRKSRPKPKTQAKPSKTNGAAHKRGGAGRPPGVIEGEMARFVQESGRATTDEVARTFNVSRKYASSVLGRLLKAGTLSTAEPVRRGHMTTWLPVQPTQEEHPGQMVLRPGEGLFRRGERRE